MIDIACSSQHCNKEWIVFYINWLKDVFVKKNPLCYFKLWIFFWVFSFRFHIFFWGSGFERLLSSLLLLWNNVKVNERGRLPKLLPLIDFNHGKLFWLLSFFLQWYSLPFVFKRAQWFSFVKELFKPFPLVEFNHGELFWLLSFFFDIDVLWHMYSPQLKLLCLYCVIIDERVRIFLLEYWYCKVWFEV